LGDLKSSRPGTADGYLGILNPGSHQARVRRGMSAQREVAAHLRELAERLGALAAHVTDAKGSVGVEDAPYVAVADYSQLGTVERGLAQAAAELKLLAEQLEVDEP
jgi:hypothetical protein